MADASPGPGPQPPGPFVQMANPLKASHADSLLNAEQYPGWSPRTEAYITDKIGFALELTPGRAQYNGQSQEFTFSFLLQVVKDKKGFEKLLVLRNAGPPANPVYSTRGIKAWNILRTYYLKQKTARLETLHRTLQQPQLPSESCSDFFARNSEHSSRDRSGRG